MKVGIWDGCANGGLMDSLSISEYDPDDGIPYYVAEVSAQKWEEWLAFLETHDKWDRYWSSKCKDENRNRIE